MTMRATVLAIELLLLGGCSSFVNRDLDDGTGNITTYAFAYGQFCGPDYPPVATGFTLQSYLPPRDDVDALCYAHDACYSQTFADNELCDSALRTSVMRYQKQFGILNKNGCFSLTADILAGFLSKPYSVGDTWWDTLSARIAHGAVATWMSIAYVGKIVVANPLLGEPEEGSCNLGVKINAEDAISAFERAYESDIFNKDKRKIQIPRAPGLTVTSSPGTAAVAN